MTTVPQIAGFTLGEQLLDHPLAGVWRGHSVTGMEVVALVLSDAGAAEPAVRERLATASRAAALEPGQAEAPLWAANLTATRPYAITQLAPGYSGAERLLDPLDGVIGNDQSAIDEVRAKLGNSNGYAASPAPPSAPGATAGTGQPAAAQYRNVKLLLAAIVAPLVVFVVTYSVGAQVNSAAGEKEPTSPRQPVPAAVEPSALPTKPVLLPGIKKAGEVPLRADVPPSYLVGRTLPASMTALADFGLPFALHDPGKNWGSVILEESSYSIYRRLIWGDPPDAPVDVWIAAHPCADKPSCLADRAEFDRRWTERFKAAVPATAKDAETWVTETKAAHGEPYRLSMTRAFFSPATKSWWLVGADATARTADVVPVAQGVLNDIRTQTS